MRRHLLLVLLCSSLIACATLRGRADDALAQGRFEDAAVLYDSILKKDPSDSSAHRLRDVARGRALLVLAGSARDARRRGREADASSTMDRLLTLSETWGDVSLDAGARATIGAEVEALAARISREVRAVLPGAPLVARDALNHERVASHKALLSTRQGLLEEIDRAGAQACSKASSGLSGEWPYWTAMARAYCIELGKDAPSAAPLPDTIGALSIQVRAVGTTAAEAAALQADVARWFTRSPWYSASGERKVTADMTGVFGVAFVHRTVELSAPWVESVPYTDTETYQEAYEEPYTETEWYTESVPYTAYESVDVPCGTSDSPQTCSDYRATTRYRDETRTRMVTKTRTEYRTATRDVTRYRDEPRVFRYQGDEVTGSYEAAFNVVVPLLSGDPPATVETSVRYSQSGVAHQASFAPAGVSPQSDGLASRAGFFRAQEAEIERTFERVMTERWRAAFCGVSTFSQESASKCVYGDPAAPAPAIDAMVAALGDDARLIVARGAFRAK